MLPRVACLCLFVVLLGSTVAFRLSRFVAVGRARPLAATEGGGDKGSQDGQFKLGAPKVSGLGETDTEPAFRRGGRQPSPLSDNLIVFASTVAGLFALVSAFLLINKDIPPPPYQ